MVLTIKVEKGYWNVFFPDSLTFQPPAIYIRLALFRAITLNISVHTCYWAAREGIACGHRRISGRRFSPPVTSDL